MRYQITRAGLINLFEYGNQAFEFAGGHLLLRGHNGAGKSKALELTLPFVLDGDTNPVKLDPFATRSRPMKWNLLMDGAHEARQGYAWLEFCHEGHDDWITLAVGLRATADSQSTDTWFVIIRGARLGETISLVNPDTNAPYAKRGLRDRLGDHAEVFDNAGAYRSRVNELLFGFQTDERYKTMLALQRQLRRPHLSRDLEPAQLSEILSGSLPDIDYELVGGLGRKLDTIEQLRDELADVRAAYAEFEAFLATYRDYARAVTLGRLEAVSDRHSALTGAGRRLAGHRQDQQTAADALEEVDSRIAQLTGQQNALRGQEQELLASPAMKIAERLRSLSETAATAGRAHQQAAAGLTDVQNDLRLARDEQRDAHDDHRAAVAESDTSARELAEHGSAARLDRHDELAAQLAAAADPANAAHAMRRAAKQRREQIAAQRDLRAAAAQAAQLAAVRRADADRAEETARSLAERKTVCDDELAAQREALSDRVGVWLSGLRELAISDELAAQLLDQVAQIDDEPGTLAALLQAAHRHADQLLADAHADLRAARETLAGRRAQLDAQRRHWLDAHDPEPKPPATRTADRVGRPGAPLWRLLDFDGQLPDGDRGALEGALQASGLLDAWVLADGTLLDVDGDVFALAAGGDGDLRRRLRPADDIPVSADVVERILAAIPCAEKDAGSRAGQLCVALDGSFRIGPAIGRHAKSVAQFIGAAAREAERRRRIEELTAAIADLEQQIESADAGLAELEARRAQLDRERGALPADAALISARRAVREVARRHADAEKSAADALGLAGEADGAAAGAAADCRAHAHEHRLPAPGHTPPLEVIEDALDEYVGALPVLVAARRSEQRELARHERATETVAKLTDRGRELDGRHRDAQARLDKAEGALEAARRRDGASAQQTLDRLDAIRGRTAEIDSELGELGEQRDDANRDEAAAASKLTGAKEAVAAAEQDQRAALELFKALGPHDLLALALAEHAPAPDQLADYSTTRVLELAREHRDMLRTRAAADTLTTRVDKEFIDLRMRLDGSLGIEPIKDLDGDLFIVSARRDGGTEPVRVMLDRLAEEIDAHERLLSEEEQRTFEEFLFNGLAAHLRERILYAHQLVAQINDAIRGCRTSSGISVDLVWRTNREHDDPLLARALKLLRVAPQALGEGQRGELVQFFRDRVEAGRATTEDGTVTEHLVEALDYRRWHSFTVMQQRDGRRVPLTKSSHQAGSGGEKSAALHLPLFAAASALMASAAAHAPRIIMLDEAFAGIDGTMRRQLLGLIDLFDLDFLLTSHELWCCEPELRRLSIYNLHRQPGLHGVAAAQFLWDGHTKHEVDAAA